MSASPDHQSARLDALIGTCRTEGEILGDDGSTTIGAIEGTDAYEWLGRFFVIHRVDVQMGDDHVEALEIVGPYDRDTGAYSTRAYDNQGGIQTSTATVDDDGVWTFGAGGRKPRPQSHGPGQWRGPIALSKSHGVRRRSDEAAYGAAKTTNVGVAMTQYMMLVYQEEVDAVERAEREAGLPMLLEFHRSLREAGLLVGVQRLRSPESATSVRVRGGEAEITDGPFAVTKEFLAGYYILECADLDEALRQAARFPDAHYSTVEVRPVMPADEWVNLARAAGADVPDEAVKELA
jgi:hypothetical protein